MVAPGQRQASWCSGTFSRATPPRTHRPLAGRRTAALITLDPGPAVLAGHSAIRAAIGAAVEQGNARPTRVEQVKRFAIVPAFRKPSGEEVTATMKVKRHAVTTK